MKRTLLLLTIGSSFGVSAQSVRRCLSKEAIDYQEQLTPGYAAQVNLQFEQARQWAAQHAEKRSVYTIPVVFHVVYNTPEENIPDSVIVNQINRLNEDYARLNEDTVNMRGVFQPLAGGTHIRFALAQIDPQGNPSTGITRTASNVQSFGSFAALMGDFSMLETVKSTVDGGMDPWDQTRYLNIWICDMSINDMPVLLGYATPPAGLPNWPVGSIPDLEDGVVLQYQAVGDNNPNDIGVPDFVVLGRTAVHEVGHYLGLRHIWGDGDCSLDDGIDDTPDATDASQQDCDTTKNTCNADVAGMGDLPDMIENYMDYSAETCQNMFTRQQAALMHGVLENQRYDLVHGNPAGVSEETIQVSCYPNPAKSTVKVFSGTAMRSISLYDLNGGCLSIREVSGYETVVDLQGLSEGVYLLVVNGENGQAVPQRIVVKH